MATIQDAGKFTTNISKIEVFGDSPKYFVQVDFESHDETGEVWSTDGRFYISLKAGGENTTATAQLKNAGWNPEGKAIYKDGEFQEHIFWDLFDEFQKCVGKSCLVETKIEVYNDRSTCRVAFIDGPHRGAGSGPKKASRPVAKEAF